MSFRDVVAMLQCLFYVNDLPGGEAHHDGGMKGRDAQRRAREPDAAADRRGDARGSTRCARSRRASSSRTARPAKGTPNLTLDAADLPARRAAGARTKPCRRAPDPKPPMPRSRRSTRSRCSSSRATSIRRRSSARPSRSLPPTNHFEMSIEEQAATLIVDGLCVQQPRAAAERRSRRSPRSSKASRARASRCGATSAISPATTKA